MAHVRRRLLDFLTVLSLLLCVAVAALWVRSYRVGDLLSHITHTGSGFRERSLVSTRGRFGWHYNDEQYVGENASRGWASDQYGVGREGLSRGTMSPWRMSPWETLGFYASNTSDTHRPMDPRTREVYTRTAVRQILNVPYYLPALLTAALPAWWAMSWQRFRRRRRLALGLCPHCGYDLRASPGRCPECGTPATR
jgi:4-amino-4-deoxy-L-arabinose transferase-like glycosyltransferase